MNGHYPQHLSDQPPHFGRTLIGHDLRRVRPLPTITTCRSARPLPAPPLSPTQPPHCGRALTSHDFRPPNAWVSRATAKLPTSWARPAEQPAPFQAQNAAAVTSAATTNEGSLISLGRNSDTGGFARCFLALFVGRAGARPLPPTTTRRTNGRYPQHLSHQRNHLTSTAF
jgi:hypothetical protein